MITIKVENAYSDGHCSDRITKVPNPTVPLGAKFPDLDEWWDAVVYLETGDGHGLDSSLGHCYMVTVLEAPDFPHLVGEQREWAG